MTGLEALRESIRRRMNDITDAVATGAASDYPAYTKMVGLIEGLALAERDLLDIQDRLASED